MLARCTRRMLTGFARAPRCVIEIFIFVMMGGSPKHIQLVPVPDVVAGAPLLPHEAIAELRRAIDTFDAAQAQCSHAEDRDRLMLVLEAAPGSVEGFNHEARELMRESLLANRRNSGDATPVPSSTPSRRMSTSSGRRSRRSSTSTVHSSNSEADDGSMPSVAATGSPMGAAVAASARAHASLAAPSEATAAGCGGSLHAHVLRTAVPGVRDVKPRAATGVVPPAAATALLSNIQLPSQVLPPRPASPILWPATPTNSPLAPSDREQAALSNSMIGMSRPQAPAPSAADDESSLHATLDVLDTTTTLFV